MILTKFAGEVVNMPGQRPDGEHSVALIPGYHAGYKFEPIHRQSFDVSTSLLAYPDRLQGNEPDRDVFALVIDMPTLPQWDKKPGPAKTYGSLGSNQ